MNQLSLFGLVDTDRVVNVASVKQRSPFRYAGGKTWLVPRVRGWFSYLSEAPDCFVEPLAGGGIVSLTVAAERLAKHVIMIEIDQQVASVWKTIIADEGGGEWLAQQILRLRMSREEAMRIIGGSPASTRELAFQTIVKNRVYHGGILAPGAAPIKNGENGRGIASRWYPETLARRIGEIVAIRERITFIEGDGLDYLARHAEQERTVYFIDPPYTAGSKKAGSRLYAHFSLDHRLLFDLTAKLKGRFLMTYDNDEAIVRLAEEHGFGYATVAMTNTHHANMKEMLISRDVSWVSG
jgi:DNA adenine methylase